MSANFRNCTLVATSGAAIVATTDTCGWYGFYAYASGANGSVVVKNSAGSTLLTWSAGAGTSIAVNPPAPCRTIGLNGTGSGGGQFILFYGTC